GSDGPSARAITFLGCGPVTMKPAIKTSLPVPTRRRVEMSPRTVGVTFGVGEAVGVGEIVGVGVAAIVGVGLGLGVGEAGVDEGVGLGVAVAVGVGEGPDCAQ